MFEFKQFISEEDNKTTSDWMSGEELAKHIPKTAIKHIRLSKEHNILVNHDLAHGGNGQLHYRIHTKSYGTYNTHTVQAASSQEDKDGFTHHVSYDIIRNTAKAHSHMKTSNERKMTVPYYQKVDK